MNETDDLVERLVKLAEPGPEIPADGAQRVKAAVRPSWEREVRTRNRRRYATWAAAAALAAILSAVLLVPRPAPVSAHITLGEFDVVRGSIALTHPVERTESAPLRGTRINAGAKLTTGTDGLAALRLADGITVRVDSGSTLHFLSAEAIVLDFGAVYVDTAGTGSLEVRTPLGVARDIGTRFEVRHEHEELLIRVREGTVALNRRGEDLRVESGNELSVRSDGSRQSRVLGAGAEEWSWLHGVAPPFAIEGRSVESFLIWISRETGYPIRYADAEAKHLASTTVLHGNLGDLRPDQAAAVILPSAGMEAARDASGALVIKRAEQ